MDCLWRRGIFLKVLHSSLTPQDRVFTSSFHYKIKRKGGEFDKCKIRLVVQGQHMRRKGEDSVGDYNNAFSPVPALSRFCTILSLATQQNMFTDHVDISQAFVQGELNYCPETVTMARFIFLHRQDMTKILSTCIVSLSHFTACPLQPELGTPP